MVRVFIFCLFWLAGSLAYAETSPELEAYTVPLGEFEKMAGLVRPLLSSDGKLIADRAHKRFLIVDKPEVHQKLSRFLKLWAPPPRNVRIRVSSASPQRIVHNGIDVSGQGRIGNVTIRSDNAQERNDIRVRAHANQLQSDLNQQQELLVVSGGKASIAIATEIPDVSWFMTWGQAYGLWSSEIKWKDVGTNMVIEPTVLPDNTIRVKLTPSFSYIVDRRWLTTEVQQLTTEVLVADGAEIDLGGVQMSDHAFSRNFFIISDEFGNSRQIRLKLRANIEELAPPPNYQ